jgi:type IV pilus assembly protein PilP
VRRTILTAGFLALLAGCSGGQEDPVADLREMVERPTPPPDEDGLKGLPEPVKGTDVRFRALQRSPYAKIPSLRDAEPEPEYTGPKPDPDRPRSPLEEFALGGLKIVATLKQEGDSGWRAYVQAPDGVVHTVQPGDYMGQHYGRVKEIGPNGVVLRELVPRGEGRWEPRERTVETNARGG